MAASNEVETPLMKKQIDSQLAFQFFTEIGIIEQLARNRLERVLPDGLTASQFGVLNHLVRAGDEWSPARLAAAFQVTKGAMTNTLKRLETRGLVKISINPLDGRGKLVSVTPIGKKMCTKCLVAVSPSFADLANDFATQDFATALPMLEKMRKYLDANRL
jgi:DNA-binding MarR family transcriptional regulator